MKDSGYAWIGEIPDKWAVSKVKQGYSIVLGKMLENAQATPEHTYESYMCAANIKFTGIDTREHRLMWFSPAEKEEYLLADNDILVTEGGTAGTCCTYRGEFAPCYIQNSVHRARAKQNFYNRFLYYWMTTVFYSGYIDIICNKATIMHYTKEKFGNTPLLICPIEDQIRIATYLDKKCAKIDALISTNHLIIEKLKEYKQSIISEVVTKGINLHVRLKDSGVEWLGAVPEHWSINRIGNLYTDTSEPGNDSLPILSVSINSGVSDKELSEDESDRMFIRSEDRSKYKRVRPGDLTYNMMRAWQGAFGAVRVDGMVSPAYIVARPKAKGIDTRFIEALMRTPPATEEMHRYSHGIADFRLRLYWPEFKNIKICLPDLSEQQQIADYIDMKSAEIDSSIATRESLIAKLTEYKKSLIYEVVTGKKEV